MISQTPAEYEKADFRLTGLISPSQAHQYQLIPWQEHGNILKCLGSGKSNSYIPQMELLTGKKIQIISLADEQILPLLQTHYPLQQQNGKKNQTIQSGDNEGDMVRLFERMLREAYDMKASDIHLERYEKEARIRFRWEGQLVEKYAVPLDRYNALISRMKILAGLDIAEKRLPQDGRIAWQYDDQKVDLRISTLPATQGEKGVIRLLHRDNSRLNIKALGLPEMEEHHLLECIQAPNGLILLTGPTGSGKTTSLYACLQHLNLPHRNILTIEDPVEYQLKGINQVQLKEHIGLNFERALKAFLRQDPDIIMVGEIRDQLTAQMAIRAALTGHLVFSTLHTNSSFEAVNRLRDMGLEAFLLADSLRLVIAQRLIRILCPVCKSLNEGQPLTFRGKKFNSYYQANGCSSCHYTGYKGRKAIFEFLPINQQLRELIRRDQLHTGSLDRQGFSSLNEQLVRLIETGETSPEEAFTKWQLND